ncbi:MAG TPA: nicotinate phosphoribosyltransferase [Thermomicrobiales bacterium]|nr:nicotinate phosphoribosyltransferase [Thermomicrobiales bacterium]
MIRDDQDSILTGPETIPADDDRTRTPEHDATGTALFTDLYHVDAAYIAWRSGHNGRSTFDVYTRRAPFAGAFMLFAGLGPTLDYLRAFRYTQDDLAWFERIKGYEPAFLDFLANLRFTGEIYAMEEGEIAFPNEPLLRVTAPFAEAMLLESGLLRTIGISTLLATKAARITLAAKGRSVSDFAFRRAHEPYLAARSSYIGGCDSTSFVAAAKDYDIPAAGTIPHALVQAFPDEVTAFRTVAESLPSYSLLLDTYNVAHGIEHAIQVALETKDTGHVLTAVRLDSGNLAADSRMVRQKLDAAGLDAVKVLVSGDMDEYKIEKLLAGGAPIDGFGVGGNLGVGLGTIESGTVGGVIGAVYKLVWYEGDGAAPARIKLAGGKSTWPGRKMPYRIGDYDHDLIARDEEPAPANARALITPWVLDGQVVRQSPDLKTIRELAMANIDALPDRFKALTPDQPYPVEFSEGMLKLRDETAHAFGGETLT